MNLTNMTATAPLKTSKLKRWSSEVVTKEIVAWHNADNPLYCHYMRSHYGELLAAGIRYFKSWRTAVESAGLPYETVRRYQCWSNDQITKMIHHLQQEGVDLSFRSMVLSKHASMVHAAVRSNHFGSWKRALVAAGLSPQEVSRYRSWEDEEILNEIRRLHQSGADLSAQTMSEHSSTFIATARRRFGNWATAVERSGIAYATVRRRRRWTQESIVLEIQKLRDQGFRLRSGEVRKDCPALFAAACKSRFFGSWNKAVQAARYHLTS